MTNAKAINTRKNRRAARLAGAACFGAVMACLAFAPAKAADLCETGTILVANPVVTVVDVEPEGVSVGDLRLAYADLVAESGEKLGMLYVRREVLPGDALVTEMYHALPEGDLIVKSVEPIDRTPLSTEKITSPEFVVSVIGGTGRYKHATGDGVYKLISADDLISATYNVTFDIECGG